VGNRGINNGQDSSTIENDITIEHDIVTIEHDSIRTVLRFHPIVRALRLF